MAMPRTAIGARTLVGAVAAAVKGTPALTEAIAAQARMMAASAAQAKAAPAAAPAMRVGAVMAGLGLAAAGLMAPTNAAKAEAAAPVARSESTLDRIRSMASQIPGLESLAPTYHVVFVLGGPGSGKGTQCANLVEEFGVVHLSAGDLLRAHIKSGTADGNMVKEMIAEGKIVPSSVTIGLLKKAMRESGKTRFLIDGFPRNEENRDSFEKEDGIEIHFVLFFDCPERVMEKRLLSRNEGRSDDNVKTIRKRFKVFVEQSMPVVQHYEKQGKVHKVDSNRDPKLVYEDTRKLFKDFVAQ